MTHEPESYHKALAELTNSLQVLIYRRETTPIRDREEVHEDLGRRIEQLQKYQTNGKRAWRKTLLELASYALFAAVSDE